MIAIYSNIIHVGYTSYGFILAFSRNQTLSDVENKGSVLGVIGKSYFFSNFGTLSTFWYFNIVSALFKAKKQCWGHFDLMLGPQTSRLTEFALLYQQISMCSKLDGFYAPGSCSTFTLPFYF